MKRNISLAIVCAVVTLSATSESISDDQVAAAIAAGLNGKGKHHGLVLRDSGQSWMAAMSGGGTGPTASSGFWLEAFTPLSWIQQQAGQAAKEYRAMTLADVGPELREPVLRVIAHADTPNTVAQGGMTGTASVQHIVLRDEAKEVVIQPIWKEPFAEEVKNAMGASVTFTGLNAKFPMEGVREIRGPKSDREFFVTVIGSTGEEKNFKVKRKHFDELK